MADKKISALTGASTPLAGTEVLPIVQSGSTVKVSVANLTAGRAVATAGGSFTDNIVQSTAAKGVNFTANTPAAGMTSQLLNWYEEGTWTPSLTTAGGAFSSITYGDQNGTYTRVGRQVTVHGYLFTTGTVSGGSGQVYVAGLPFSAASLAVGNVWINPDTANYGSPSALPTGCTTSGTQLRLFKNGTTNNSTFNSTELATSGNANYIAFTATYFV